MSNTQGPFTFDGPNKIISCALGTYSFSASGIYSRWKDWLQDDPERMRFEPAFSGSVGGESLGGGVFVGGYFFLQNGWSIRPMEQDHQLILSGNLFPIPDNAALFTSTLGDFQVIVGMRTSSLTQQVVSSTGGGGSTDTTTLNAIKANTDLIPGLL